MKRFLGYCVRNAFLIVASLVFIAAFLCACACEAIDDGAQ